MKKSKKLILFLMILGFIFIGVGVSYAYFIYRGTTSNMGEIIAGDIYMNFTYSDAFSLSLTKLESIDDARNRDNNMINFTISGDNSSNRNIIYSINLKHGEDVNGLNRVFDKAVRFDLVETTGGNEVFLADAAKFDDFDNIVIYVASIDGDTHNYERNFYVRAWISNDNIISDTDPNADFCASVNCESGLPLLTNSFMNFNVEVFGDFEDKIREKW